MPSLSFTPSDKARPIARVKGGANDNDILYLSEDMDMKPLKPAGGAGATGGGSAARGAAKPTQRTKYITALGSVKPAERTRIMARLDEALAKGISPDALTGEGTDTKKVYEMMMKDMTSDKSIELDDEGAFELLPSPDPKRREVWYIAGQSGSGKSYIAKGLAAYYHKLFPDRGVYLVSKLKEDATLDALKFLKRLNIQSFIDDYPDLEEFRDCLVIFDDYDTLTGDAEKTILKIVDDLAIMGRHTNTSMLCLSHYLTNYKKTRLLLNEATHVVVYPLSTSYHALRYLIKNYIGVGEDDLKRHRKLGSRWLCYSKGFPQYMVAQKAAELLHFD